MGSCISRDPFELDSNNHDVSYYASRSSLISSAHDKSLSELKTKEFKNHFKNRIVNDDFKKNFKSYAKVPQSDGLIIDLIQERYGVMSCNGGYYTYSPEHKEAGINEGQLIRYNDHFELFKNNIEEISNMLSSYNLIVLHDVNLCPLYHTKEGIKTIPINQQDEYFLKNGSKYYNLLKEYLPNVYSLEIEGYIGTENHR